MKIRWNHSCLAETIIYIDKLTGKEVELRQCKTCKKEMRNIRKKKRNRKELVLYSNKD